MATNSDLDRLGAAKYVRLTTFKRDGTAVPTPIWLVRDGDALLMITSASTGKVKRLRHTSRVLLAVSDGRGRVAAGVAEVEATATLVEDPAEVKRLEGLLRRRYGVMYTVARFANRLRGTSLDSGTEIRVTLP